MQEIQSPNSLCIHERFKLQDQGSVQGLTCTILELTSGIKPKGQGKLLDNIEASMVRCPCNNRPQISHYQQKVVFIEPIKVSKLSLNSIQDGLNGHGGSESYGQDFQHS